MSIVFFKRSKISEHSFSWARRVQWAYPFRDVQRFSPCACCCRCGEEQYDEDRMEESCGGVLCERCREEEEEMRHGEHPLSSRE